MIQCPCHGNARRHEMNAMTTEWISAFDSAMLHLYGIDLEDAGVDKKTLARYGDLMPSDAALAYGADYDLDRLDALWRPSNKGSYQLSSLFQSQRVASSRAR